MWKLLALLSLLACRTTVLASYDIPALQGRYNLGRMRDGATIPASTLARADQTVRQTDFPSTTDGPPLDILQQLQRRQNNAGSSSSTVNAVGTGSSVCNTKPTCSINTLDLFVCTLNFDDPNNSFCHCADGCNYKTFTDPANGDCAWTKTPPITPMPVDCSQPLSSCNYDQWQPTVSNWLEANVDGELSSFAFDMVTDAPTGTLKNTWPTKLPRIGTGPSNRTDAVGIAGKLMAAAGGGISANCSILEGSNGQCGRPPSVQDSCGSMPRWAYLAWQAIYNMVSIHIEIVAVLNSDSIYALGQLDTLIKTFQTPAPNNLGLQIFLTVLGAVATVVGIMLPLAELGAAAMINVATKDLAIGVRKGEEALARGAADDEAAAAGAATVPKSPGQIAPEPKPAGSDPNQDDDITPVVPAPGEAAPPLPTPGKKPEVGVDGHPVVQQGSSDSKTFGANVFWVMPGTVISMSNSIWQQISGKMDPTAESAALEKATSDYFKNMHDIMQTYNDGLMAENYDDGNINDLLNVLSQGLFIATSWSEEVFETVISADIIAREINAIWRGQDYFIYVSFTNLDDDKNFTKCQNDTNGNFYSGFCSDGGVYYLAYLNFPPVVPSLIGPPGFDSLTEYGIYPYWPSSGSARAYRALNPDPKKTPVYDPDSADEAYSDFITDFATNDTSGLLNLIGQTPGTWTLPVCDQGRNFWMFDWGTSGGHPEYQYPVPCSCGWRGTGTAAFYKSLNLPDAGLDWVLSACSMNLQNVDPGLELKKENMGWNQVLGADGWTDRKIVYGGSYTLTAPDPMPTGLYFIGDSKANGMPDTTGHCGGKDCD